MEPAGVAANIEGQDIICFSNDWHSDPLSRKHMMLRLARRNRVLWVNSIGTRNPRFSLRDLRRAADKVWQFARGSQRGEENIVVYSPLAIPFHGNRMARRANRYWLSWSVRRVCERLGFERPITWSFLPSTSEVAGTLGEKLVIYHCEDEYSEFSGTDRETLLSMERRLLETAHVVIVTSEPLLRAKRPFNANTHLVTHGVEVLHFRQACEAATTVPEEIAALPRPVIGFFGLIEDWVDLDLIRFLALARPNWSFVLIGSVRTSTQPLRGLANVHLLGRRDYASLPACCKGFSVALVPFKLNALTEAVNPLKLREYLAAGLPVVSVPLPEVYRLRSLVRIGNGYAHFLEQVEAYLAEGRVGPQLATSLAMDHESWDHKLAEIGSIIRGVDPTIRSSETALAAILQETPVGGP